MNIRTVHIAAAAAALLSSQACAITVEVAPGEPECVRRAAAGLRADLDRACPGHGADTRRIVARTVPDGRWEASVRTCEISAIPSYDSVWGPKPVTTPLSITRILSHFSTLLMRCAMMSFVIEGSCSRKACWMRASVRVSQADVESSRTRIFGCFKRARAMHRRCFWPPLTLVPPCAITVSYCCGISMMKSSA